MARWHSCNVLQAEKEVRHLWQFSVGGDKFTLQRDEAKLPNEALPSRVIAKDWQNLFQPKLNVAWLPSRQVFLRVVPLPKSDLAETQSMIELQLEKLSPSPVAQVVWTFELVPTAEKDLQTAIVIIVARHHVEEFLGQIEGQGYLADRLELPLLDQIRATRITTDGLWIYPGAGPDQYSCLVGWWYGGTLRNLSLIHLPATENRGKLLQEQLAQMAWAGELEGWLTAPPAHHLVADAETAAAWTPFFTPEQGVIVVSPLSAPELAALTARRAAANGVVTGLMPPEYAARYRQQFIDRLWMHSLGAVLLIYVFGVVIYFGLMQFAQWRLGRVQNQIGAVAASYTNALQMKEQVRVLQDQLDLQYAALDCYKAVAEFLPAELTLDTFNFERGGRRVTLFGTAPPEESSKVTEFNAAMRKAMVKNQPLFSKVQPPAISQRANLSAWSFWCDLKRTATE